MDTQRRQLSDFLKSCRARLSPGQVGLPDTNRRRTPGLRREDVAALAGVSVTWYTWLEQGRDIQVSAEVLERICTTLRMTADEREYLFALVQRLERSRGDPDVGTDARRTGRAGHCHDDAVGRDCLERPGR